MAKTGNDLAEYRQLTAETIANMDVSLKEATARISQKFDRFTRAQCDSAIKRAKKIAAEREELKAASEYPTPTIGFVIPCDVAWPLPYPYEVAAWETVDRMRARIAALRDELVDLRYRLEDVENGRESTSYTIDDVGYGDLVDQINEALAVVASDIHRRGQIDEPRKISVAVKGEPSENSAAVAWTYEVTINLAKSKGGGTAYLDKEGRLQRPQDVGAEQIMLPVNSDNREAA